MAAYRLAVSIRQRSIACWMWI